MRDVISMLSGMYFDWQTSGDLRFVMSHSFRLQCPMSLAAMMAYEPVEYVAAAILACNQRGE